MAVVFSYRHTGLRYSSGRHRQRRRRCRRCRRHCMAWGGSCVNFIILWSVFGSRSEWNAIVYAIRRAVIIISTALISVDYTKCDIISMDNGVKDYLQRLKDTGKNDRAEKRGQFYCYFFFFFFCPHFLLVCSNGKEQKKKRRTKQSRRTVYGDTARRTLCSPASRIL